MKERQLEPTEELARFAFDEAHRLCDPAHGCLPYHKVWSVLRVLGVNYKRLHAEDFFYREMAARLTPERSRILISGAADTGILGMLLRGSEPLGFMPSFVLADRCLTVIEQNRRYAEAAGIDVQLIHGDIREIACDPVDLIVAHSFLTFFDRRGLRELFAAWFRVLRPGGAVALFNRLATADMGPKQPPSAEAVAARSAQVAAVAREYGWRESEIPEICKADAEVKMLAVALRPLLDTEFFESVAAAGLEVGRADYHGSSAARTQESREAYARVGYPSYVSGEIALTRPAAGVSSP